MVVCNKAGRPVCELDDYESMVTRWLCSQAKCAKRWDPTGDYWACCKCSQGYYLNNPWNAFDIAQPPYCVACSKKVKNCALCDYYGTYNSRKFDCFKVGCEVYIMHVIIMHCFVLILLSFINWVVAVQDRLQTHSTGHQTDLCARLTQLNWWLGSEILIIYSQVYCHTKTHRTWTNE